MTANISHKPYQKAVQRVILVDLYVQVVQLCTAWLAIYCRETCTQLVKLSVQRGKLYGVHTLIKVCHLYTSGLYSSMKCIHCGNENTEARKTIKQNGAIGIAIYCLDCGKRATAKAWESKSLFSAAEIDAMPIEANYTGGVACGYRGCQSPAIEWNHYAPRYLFGDDADNWPVGPLCVAHHKEWHMAIDRKCPTCREPISATAIVDTFREPGDWEFWGVEGARWLRCRSEAFVHFYVLLGGRQHHRLAIIRSHAADWLATEQAAAETNRANGLSRNHVEPADYDGYAKRENECDWLEAI